MSPSIGSEIVFWLRTKRRSAEATPPEFGGRSYRPKKKALLRGRVRAIVVETTPNGAYHFARVTYRKHDYMVPFQNIIPAERVAEAAFNMRVPVP